MSKPITDNPPGSTGDHPLIGIVNTQFERLQAWIDALETTLNARLDALENRPPSAPTAAPLATSSNSPAAVAQPVSISDPNAFLTALLTTITDLGRPLNDAEIVAYRDACKNAILALRAGQVGSTKPQTRDTIAYEAATRDAFTSVMAVLFDNARSRDPYAAQLQIV